MEAFAGDEDRAVERAVAAGVTMMVFPGVSPESQDALEELHARHPEHTRIAIGLHPTELGDDWQSKLDDIESSLSKGKYSAIGEVGIDLHWEKENVEDQKLAFARQLAWAQRYGLPLIIHCRDGVEETLDVIRKAEGTLPVMIFHSFTSGPEDVRKIREVCDPYFGINGVVTFKNAAELREALPEIGIDRMVLETDAPYLAPVPYRGSRNESAYIPMIKEKIAETLGLPPAEVERITDDNAKKIFRF